MFLIKGNQLKVDIKYGYNATILFHKEGDEDKDFEDVLKQVSQKKFNEVETLVFSWESISMKERK